MPVVLDPVNGITQASWTTAGRPGSPTAGQVGFNTSLNALEQYTGSSWETIPTWTTANRPVTPAAGYSGYNTDTKAFEFYNGTTWIGFNQSSLSTTASYLLVAGGAGGGSYGGGGAGGYLTGTATLNLNNTYYVTVGGGGSGGAAAAGVRGTNGADSSISGANLAIITSTGGGAGGGNLTGVSGGSGGGGGYGQTGGSGTPGQGNAGGTGTSPSFAGGGGGGSSAVGAAATPGNGGAGGNGTASSINGTSVTYAGGGGGGGLTAGANGGIGGGGKGSSATSSNNTAGNSNTGGGGGGGRDNTGSSGGSGVAIISYPGSQVFTGGTVTSSGGNTIHTFTTSAALIPTTTGSTFNNSLRFRSSASAYLSRTFSTTGTNNKVWTWSAWVKLGSLTVNRPLFGGGITATPLSTIYLSAGDKLSYTITGIGSVASSAVLRDPSAWYHVVVAVDTTQAIDTNRIKMYINGVQQSYTGTVPIALNSTSGINSATAHRLGSETDTPATYFDGYMTNVYFIDGQALSPANFGTNSSNGTWIPVPYTGTYGTNGFYLNFGDGPFLTTSSNTGIGKDSSGNGNYWVTNNISVTTGTTFDLMIDVPTLTSATAANYAVMNPLVRMTTGVGVSVSPTISEGNLKVVPSANNNGTLGSFGVSSGKWYWEVNVVTGTVSNNVIAGISYDPASSLYSSGVGYEAGGNKIINGTSTAYGSSTTTNDVIGIALDADATTVTFYKNNTSQGSISYTATNPIIYPSYASGGGVSASHAFNFGQRPFSYTPPSGYVALNTYNLTTPTIVQGNLYMDATLWTGAGSSSGVAIVNQAGFKPDFVWMKSRSTTFNNWLFDSNRGVGKLLASNLTDAEANYPTILSAFNSNGFTTNSNASTDTFVGWQWQAGQGTNTTNTNGSITTTTSVNTTAGFSVFTFTGTGASASVGHGLGVAPKFMIFKRRNSTSDWNVLTNATGSNQYGFLDLTTAFAAAGETWNSTVINIGGNFVNGGTYVCYAWAEITGFSKFGSYTGNGSTDGTFVYTGFRPKYVMIKVTSTTEDWYIWDTSRGTYNANTPILYADLSAAESTSAIDTLSNGFKCRTAQTLQNANGATYIYMAFAENPFKYANAR